MACGGVPFKRCGTRLAVGAWRQGRPEHRQNIDLKESCVGNGRDVVACYNLIIRALPWQVEGPQGGAGPSVRFIQTASLESLLAPKSIANLPQ